MSSHSSFYFSDESTSTQDSKNNSLNTTLSDIKSNSKISQRKRVTFSKVEITKIQSYKKFYRTSNIKPTIIIENKEIDCNCQCKLF